MKPLSKEEREEIQRTLNTGSVMPASNTPATHRREFYRVSPIGGAGQEFKARQNAVEFAQYLKQIGYKRVTIWRVIEERTRVNDRIASES